MVIPDSIKDALMDEILIRTAFLERAVLLEISEAEHPAIRRRQISCISEDKLLMTERTRRI